MKKISVDKYKSLMGRPLNIRNMCVIGQMDHGKTTVIEAMLAKGQSIDFTPPPPPDENDLEGEEEPEEKPETPEPPSTMTVKAKPYALVHQLSEENLTLIADTDKKAKNENKFLMNIMDTPGHVDFSAEVTAALRISDGALLIVDCISGCCIQTEMVIRQSISERVKPVLFLNKMDRSFLEFCLSKEELYQILNSVITKINIIIATYNDNSTWSKDLSVDPSKGTVIFGSGLDGWAFSIRDFADIYSTLFKASTAKIMDKLWGDDFFNKSTKKWTKTKRDHSERGFNMFILDPIFKIFDAIMNFKKRETEKLLKTLNIELSPDDLKLDGKNLLRVVMSSWLNATETLFRMVVFHLPSPVIAQKYRTENLYCGPTTDDAYDGMVKCDLEGPVMMYISKMIPARKRGRFHGFGRVFSGTLSPNQGVRYMKPKYRPDKNSHLIKKDIKGSPFVVSGDETEDISGIPAGNWCGIEGVDKYFTKVGTVSSYREAHVIKEMKFSVSPVILAVVEPYDEEDLPNLMEGLQRLTQSDVLVKRYLDDTGANVFGVSGEIHLENCLRELEDTHAKVAIKRNEPLVSIRETVSMTSSEVTLTKSPNNLYRIFMNAEPLEEDLCIDIDKKIITPYGDKNERKHYLKDRYGFDSHLASKIWAFGPEHHGPNFLIDKTKGVKQIKNMEEPIAGIFQMVTKEGPLCDEPMRGVMFNLEDIKVMKASKDESFQGQVSDTARRAMHASFLRASPRVLEPVYLVEAICSELNLRIIYDIISSRRGIVYEDHRVTGTSMNVIRAHVPISNSFGLLDELQKETEEKINCQCVFDHWKLMIGDPLDDCSDQNKAYSFVKKIRKRKGLKSSLPKAEDFADILNNIESEQLEADEAADKK